MITITEKAAKKLGEGRAVDFVAELAKDAKFHDGLYAITTPQWLKLIARAGIKFNEAQRFTTRDSDRMPSPARSAANATGAILRTAGALVSGQPIYCTDAEEKEREKICRTSGPNGQDCPAFIAAEMRCMDCSCFLRSKLVSKWNLRHETCPRGLWPLLSQS